jgi:hypothetical protein
MFLRIEDTDLLAELLTHDLIGSSRSESFDTTTAISKRPMWASCSRCVARFTSDPFLGLYHLHVFLTLTGGHSQRHRNLMTRRMTQMY